jgi:hypothetical protein
LKLPADVNGADLVLSADVSGADLVLSANATDSNNVASSCNTVAPTGHYIFFSSSTALGFYKGS